MKFPSFDFWKPNANEGLCYEILNLPTPIISMNIFCSPMEWEFSVTDVLY